MTANDSSKSSSGGGKAERNNVCGGKVKEVCSSSAEVETDQESIGSSEDMESPRSVAKFRRWTTTAAEEKNIMGGGGGNYYYVHSQILRIREEDSHLGQDIPDYAPSSHNNNNTRIVSVSGHRKIEIRLCSRQQQQQPVSRASSPLGGDKTVH